MLLHFITVCDRTINSPFQSFHSCPSIEVIDLHKDGVAALVDGREVVDERSLFLHRVGEMVLVLHGWRTERRGTKQSVVVKLRSYRPAAAL